MQEFIIRSTKILSAFFLLTLSFTASAEKIQLMDGIEPRPGDDRMTKVNEFKKDGPWTIGMSHFGINANTWTLQMSYESEGEANRDERIKKFILLDAKVSQAKQASDINKLIEANVDVIIVTPLTPTSADAGISKAIDAGIPVIVHTGLTQSDKYTVDIQGGGENFGKVMGDWLNNELNGEGDIWVLRGLPDHPEDINRYNGLLKSLENTNINIVAEEAGYWKSNKGRKVCEKFYQNNPNVDGIWSSGADMTRACIKVFEKNGSKVPPITGEGNNGFFRMWIDRGIRSISAEYSPEQGAAGVRAAIALLEGKPLHKRYIYEPAGWDLDKVKQYHRRDLSSDIWFPTSLSEEDLQKYYGWFPTSINKEALQKFYDNKKRGE